MVTLRVMLGKPQHIVDRLRLMTTKTNSHTEGRVRQNTILNTQQTDFGLRGVKTYGNTESHARRKEDS